MQKKPLRELLQELELELLRLGYTEGSMKFYHSRWKKIIQFAEERDEIFYSEQLGINYIEHHYQILEKDFDKTLFQKDTQELRIIRMIGNFQLHHTVLRTKSRSASRIKKHGSWARRTAPSSMPTMARSALIRSARSS